LELMHSNCIYTELFTGSDYGDLVLIEMSKRIRYCLRPDDIAARLGGDEFVVLLEHLNTETALIIVSDIANKICLSLSQPVKANDITIQISTSIGVSLFGKNTDTLQEQFKQADIAVYKAKAEGRNRVVFFNNES
ncbi:MAG: GGDEF domain-containing protein, partial [Methylotenera sp.]|uniref:GGDEF domain-containing protein n=1 Tax=Methylotenera sp. TaxID=2051956 RepID=UPI0024879DAE